MHFFVKITKTSRNYNCDKVDIIVRVGLYVDSNDQASTPFFFWVSVRTFQLWDFKKSLGAMKILLLWWSISDRVPPYRPPATGHEVVQTDPFRKANSCYVSQYWTQIFTQGTLNATLEVTNLGLILKILTPHCYLHPDTSWWRGDWRS